MKMAGKPCVLLLFLSVLVVLNACVWWYVVHPAEPVFSVSFLDIGQGDAILIESPTGADILIDGGPDRSVLRELPRKLGLFDRDIDLVVATHPDKDHIAGLIDILERYQVSYFLEPGIPNDTSYAHALEDAVTREPDLHRFIARRGMRLHLGGDAYADILFPDRDVSKGETNDGSIAMRIVYGSTSFFTAGDLSTKIEDYLVSLDGEALKSDVLKASHHGSKHSTSATWLAAVHPFVVVISAGKGNSYGHPAPEVVDRVRAAGARIVSTIDEGTITFVSDGDTVKKE